MIKINISKEKLFEVAMTGLTAAAYALAIAACVTDTSITTVKDIFSKADYNDAVDAVITSSMFSSDKREVLDLIKADGDAAYYKAVIKVLESHMFSSDKVDAIRMLSIK